MKVLHIAYQYGCNNTGGAAIAATRLHLALLEKGIESHYLCLRQCEPGINVHVLSDSMMWFGRLYSFGKVRALWRYLNLPVPGVEKLINEICPDVVHIQWMNNGGPSWRQLVKINCKVIVNLHDAWMLTADNPVPISDDRFITGYNRKNSSLIERMMFARKRRFFAESRPVVIGPSKWICEEGRKSIVARHCRFFVVSNLVDRRFFLRIEWLEHKKFTIVFGCRGGSRNRGKRFCDLIAAVKLIPKEVRREMEIVVFGEERASEIIADVPIRYAGCIDAPDDLIRIYAGGDLFAFPSLSETQGLTKIEAMVCGLPVVAFDRTACAEGIEHGKSGWIAHDGDVSDFAKGIMYFRGLKACGKLSAVKNEIKAMARAQFSIDAAVDKILTIYRD